MATDCQDVARWISAAAGTLKNKAIGDSPLLDAQLLACHVLNMSRAQLYAFPETTINAEHCASLQAYLQRRISGESVAAIIGSREFWSMQLRVNSATLVPRSDTEILVEQAIIWSNKAPDGPIVDLGTGTGAVAIALAMELPQRKIIAIERSSAALPVAQLNVREHAAKISLVQGSWLECLSESSMAMIVSNPPYLSQDDPHLTTLAREPQEALVSGNTGMEDLQHIIEHSVRVGMHGAPLLLEHGSEQGFQVRKLLQENQYKDVGTATDLANLERVSFGCISKP